MNLKIIVVVNKIDRPDARLDEIGDEVLELLMDLDASEEQLENTPFLYCSGRDGTASLDPHGNGTDLIPLFDTIVNYVNPPEGDPEAPLQMLISSIDYNEYVGRIGIGRIARGTIQVNQQVMIGNYHDPETASRNKVVSLLQIQGLQKFRQNLQPSAILFGSAAFPIFPSAIPFVLRIALNRSRSQKSVNRP